MFRCNIWWIREVYWSQNWQSSLNLPNFVWYFSLVLKDCTRIFKWTLKQRCPIYNVTLKSCVIFAKRVTWNTLSPYRPFKCQPLEGGRGWSQKSNSKYPCFQIRISKVKRGSFQALQEMMLATSMASSNQFKVRFFVKGRN